MLLAIEIKTFIAIFFLSCWTRAHSFQPQKLFHDTYLLTSSKDMFPLIYLFVLEKVRAREVRRKEEGNVVRVRND